MSVAHNPVADFGFDSIGGVATTKVQQNALTSGFPSAYASVYASKQIAPRFFPEVSKGGAGTFWAGDDLQCQIHEQRRKDADYMARAKVIATQKSRVRYVGTPYGVGEIPAMVLGQRIFANPSNGLFETNSAREDHASAPFHLSIATGGGGSHTTSTLRGGVLRTMEGQRYGKKILDNRIQQLNTIQQAKQSFMEGNTGQRLPTPGEVLRYTSTQLPAIGQASLIELNLLLQSVADAVIGGEDAGQINHLSSLTYKDTTKAVVAIFNLAPSMTDDDLDGLYANIDLIANNLDAILATGRAEESLPATDKEIALTLDIIFKKLRVYTRKMIEGATLSPKERVDLSKALVIQLAFAKILKYAGDNFRELLDYATPAQRQRAEVGDISSSDESGGDSDDDSGNFYRQAETREDAEHRAQTGVLRSSRNFTPDVRQEFGAQSGEMFPTGNAVRGTQALFGEAPDARPGDATVGSLPPVKRPKKSASDSGSSVASRRPNPARSISSFWDKDTQGFNLSTTGKPGSNAQTGSVYTTTTQVAIPTSQSELPTTVEGYEALSEELRKKGITINVYDGTSVANLRRNFIKRLGLVGKYR